MWQQNLLELFVTDIPQSLAIVFLFFTLLDIKYEIKSFYFISFAYAILPYLVKPVVSGGVQPFISLIALVLISIILIKTNMIKSILFAISSFCIAIFAELLSMGILLMNNFDINLLETDSFIKAIAGIIPIAILFAVGAIIWYVKQKIKRNNKNAAI